MHARPYNRDYEFEISRRILLNHAMALNNPFILIDVLCRDSRHSISRETQSNKL